MLPPSRISADVAIESLAQCALRGFAHHGVRVGQIPRPAVAGDNIHRYAFRQVFLQMLFRQFQDLLAVLFGNETKREFRKRVAGNYCFRPLPLIAAADPIDLSSRSRPDAFD